MKIFKIEEGYDKDFQSFWYIHNNETGEDYGNYSTYENAKFALENWF